MMCDECLFLSSNLKIDSILHVCLMMKKLNLHLVCMLSFIKNFLPSTSFVLQKERWIQSLGLLLNRRTEIIVSSVFGFSKSWMISLINVAGYPALMSDCLMTLTSTFQLVAIRFASCKGLE